LDFEQGFELCNEKSGIETLCKPQLNLRICTKSHSFKNKDLLPLKTHKTGANLLTYEKLSLLAYFPFSLLSIHFPVNFFYFSTFLTGSFTFSFAHFLIRN